MTDEPIPQGTDTADTGEEPDIVPAPAASLDPPGPPPPPPPPAPTQVSASGPSEVAMDASQMSEILKRVKRDVPPPVDDDALDLTSLISTRKAVKLPTRENPAGETFEMRLLDDFGIVEQQELLTWSNRFESLFNRANEGTDLTNEEKVSLEHLLNKIFERILVIPPSLGLTHADFGSNMKARVLNAFGLAPQLMRQRAEARLLQQAQEEAKLNPEMLTSTSAS